ncbi:hypothetical protein [Streptomyces sp. NPDC048392]|uniref:hypothetical protein n=1 Tax=Streptomyces sp. NPDC048392 TaxID=3365543 RepID=UPI00371AF7BE
MSDHARLASTGIGGALAVGGAIVTGWWLLAAAAGIVIVGACLIRFGFRRGKNAGQQ